MNKEFIPYKEALALKELGFDEKCCAIYRDFDKSKSPYIEFAHVNKIGEMTFLSNSDATWMLTIPTYSQAFRWFRERHNFHAEITWSPSYEYDPGKWSDAIYEITITNVSYTKEWVAKSPDMQRGNGKQLTYEEAELECLKKLIELIKNK